MQREIPKPLDLKKAKPVILTPEQRVTLSHLHKPSVRSARLRATPGQYWNAYGAFAGDTIAMQAHSNHGGAIASLSLRNHEYINSVDNGRLLQTAVFYDANMVGEADNPTEGGAQADPTDYSSSEILVESGAGDTITGVSFPAYWVPWQNQIVSDTVLGKTAQIGWHGIPNLIHDRIVMRPGTNHDNATFEVLTSYLGTEHWVMLSLDPLTGHYSDIQNWGSFDVGGVTCYWLSSNNGGRDAIVCETDDGMHAVGMWSKDPELVQCGMLLLNIPTPCVKLNTVEYATAPQHRMVNLIGGQFYVREAVFAVGRIWEVGDAIQRSSAEQWDTV